MKERKISRKVISIVVSLLMIVGMIPMGAFVASAATAPVYSSGDWIVPEGTWNGNMNGFSNNGAQPAYSTIGIHDTNYVFMQTEDNQAFTYTVNLYIKRNSGVNHVKMMSLDTNYNGSADDFVPLITSEYWYCNSGDTVRWVNGSTFPEDVEFNSTTAIPVTYTVEFTAAGSAVYHPEWTMVVRTRSYQFDSYHNYYMDALSYNNSTDNYDPVFTIQVIDLREVRTLISIAQDLGLTVSDYTGGRDFSGATYYSQQTVDEVVAALRQALLCDYTYLDAQLARAAALDPNYAGGLGYNLYDNDLYAAFESAYADAQAVDRFLMSDGTGANEAIISNAALALDNAINALLDSRNALITFYDGTELIGRNVVNPADGYNLHDTVHKRGNEYFITVPEKTGYVFDHWADSNNNKIDENTVITGDMTVYAKYKVKLNGVAPLSTSGRWDHVMVNTTNPDGDYYMWGENYVTMWVEDTNFNFIQTQDNEVFSFYADFTAVKNQGSNYARINSVYLLNDTDTNTFVDRLDSTNGIEVYCVTPQFGNGNQPSENDTTGNGSPDGLLPAIPLNNHASQMSAYFVTWRYVYAFSGNGAATYTPKWNINYNSGAQDAVGGSTFSTQYDLTDSGDSYVNFTINVSDARELINAINKAESVLNNSNVNFTEAEHNSLRAILDDIEANYVLDGSVYYTQTDLDTQTARIKAIIPDNMTIPCDYTELDAAVAIAEQKMVEYNNNSNNHFIDEVWTDFTTAYTAAKAIADDANRPLDILPDNSNQTAIDNATEELLRAINALTYKSHVNEPCEYDPIDDLVDDAVNTYGDDITDNSDGKYDDDAYQDYLDALEHAQDVINQDYYVDSDGNNDNQQIIDDALDALQDAIDNLNNPANQNDPCDYTALEDAIAAAQSINDNSLFTDTTYQALLDALDDAYNVPADLYDDDSGNNQQMIDDATDALINAINNLLADAIANAQSVDTTGMDTNTVDALDTAVSDAQVVATDSNASAQDKADAINAITAAVDNLAADKTELELAIYSAGLIDTTDVPQSLVDALDAAVANGQLVDGDPDASVSSVEYATEQITNAIADILQQVINDASNADTTGMTTNSIQDLEDAIDNAQTTHDDIDSNAYTFAEAIADVQNALADLEPDKTELEELISIAGAIDTTNIDSAVAQELADAITDGETVDADTNATVSEIADAVQAIKDAIDDVLQSIVNDAQNIDTTGMTPTSEANFNDALDAAEDILTNGGTDQEKADAINALVAAIDNLNPDKQALEDAIDAGEAINTTGISQTLIDALEDALTDGNAVDIDTDATVQEIADATDAITDAIADILAEVISQAENTDTTGMTDQSIQDLQDVIDAAEDLLDPNRDPAATAEELADAIKDIQDAVNDLTPDKTELQDAVDAAETIDPTNLDPTVAQDLQDAIDNGNDVLSDPDATVQEIQDAIDQINDAIDQILQDAIDDAKNTDTTDMTDDSKQDLQDAITDAENVQNDPNSDAQDKVDAINDINGAVTGLALNKITTKENVAVAVDRVTPVDTQYTYMVGLNPAGTVVNDIKAQLKNDESMIIITTADGNTELGTNDLVGTGCLIKLVNANDHSVVYEVATVILYGDVNGDGLVNDSDKGTIGGDAFYGESNLTAGSVYYIAADLSKDGTLDAFDYFLVDGIMTGGREFDQTSELYK